MKQKIGFDADKYIEEQSKYIIERINQGNSERLYLEFGGDITQSRARIPVIGGSDHWWDSHYSYDDSLVLPGGFIIQVPEPNTALLSLLGLVSVLAARRRRR